MSAVRFPPFAFRKLQLFIDDAGNYRERLPDG